MAFAAARRRKVTLRRVLAYLIRPLKAREEWLVHAELFRVHGDFEQRDRPQFCLRPTRALFVWIALGTFVTTIPLARGWLSAGLTVLAVLWALLLLHRYWALSKEVLHLKGTVAFRLSPRGKSRRRCLVWLPVAIMASFGSATMWLYHGVSQSAPANHYLSLSSIYVWLSALTLTSIWWLISKRGSGFALPDLTRYYNSLPSSVRPLVVASTSRRAKYPSATWRGLPDVSSEVTAAGISLALFGSSDVGPVWKTSVKCFVWYFAPVMVPLLAIFSGPLLNIALQPYLGNYLPALEKPDKISLGLSAMVWAAWSVAFFVALGSRDFIDPARIRALDGRFLAKVFAHWSAPRRTVAARFFAGAGSAAFHLLVLAVVPIYFDYVGLFDPSDESKQTSPNATFSTQEFSPTETSSKVDAPSPTPASVATASAPKPAPAASVASQPTEFVLAGKHKNCKLRAGHEKK